jgi:thiamine-phosphate diphosphorylase
VILCLVTDRRRRSVTKQCLAASRAGVDLIQVREPDLDAAALSALVVQLIELTHTTKTRVVVNDRIDVALACGAGGVHLRGDSIPPDRARSIVPPGFLIGQSVRAVDQAVQAARHADYLIAGTVFPTPSKPGLRGHLGVVGLSAIARSVRVPVLAIGGVSIDRIEAVARSGAGGIAAIGLFDAEGEALVSAVREVRHRFDSARSAS